MKAIVTNILLGSMVSIALGELPASANLTEDKDKEKTIANISATALDHLGNYILLPAFVFEIQQFDYYISTEEKNKFKNSIYQNYQKLNQGFLDFDSNVNEKKISPIKKKPYLSSSDRENVIVGKHRVFWHEGNKQKYWGLTTVKTWGDREELDNIVGAASLDQNRAKNLSLKKLNYLYSAPVLAPGTSTLTMSGGSHRNLTESSILLKENNDFQGGVAFHHSLAEEFTLGLGLIYEDFLQGFSQFTYQPENFPLRTTVSLIQGQDGLDVYSHLQLQPSETMVLNLYSDEKDQKFNFNWGLASGLTLTADGNSKTESLRGGAKLNFKNELFSLFAKAQLDNNDKLQWEVNTQLGNLQLKYSINSRKSNTEIKYKFSSFSDSGVSCSFSFQNKTRQRRKEEEHLAIWGWNLYSSETNNNRPRWKFGLGYGVGSAGTGAIANIETAIDSSLSLKLSYESISLSSEDTRLKLELKSH